MDIVPRRIAMVVYPGVQIIDATAPLDQFATVREIFESAPGKPCAYETLLIGPSKEPVQTSCGIRIVPDHGIDDVIEPVDSVMIAGGIGVFDVMKDRTLVDGILRIAASARRVASVCSGAFLLAEAGLLDGRTVTTHWRACGLVAKRYPAVSVDPDPIYIKDGNVYTSAGVTAGMDLALALIEEDYSRDLALAVAREKVMFLKRPGGQAQFSAHLTAQTTESDRLRAVQDWILNNLEKDLTVPVLAERAAMSPRNFARVFVRDTGVTPAKFVELARIEESRRRLEDTATPLSIVANACGFGNLERFRKTFFRRFRVTPQEYRQRFRVAAD